MVGPGNVTRDIHATNSGGLYDHDYRCEWSSDGKRCLYPGAFSFSTVGGGPHYCSGHSRCSDGAAGAAIVAESIRTGGSLGQNSPRAQREARLDQAIDVEFTRATFKALGITREGPSKTGRRWAQALIARHVSGFPVVSFALDSACAALGVGKIDVDTA